MRLKSPILIVIFGLPGTGKTTFARVLSKRLKIKHYNTDVIRGLLGKREHYDEQDKVLVYDEMMDLTKQEFEKKRSVVLDGTFYKKALRKKFQDMASKHKVSIKWIEVCADKETVKKRVSEARRYSEADYAVYQKIKEEFEPMENGYLQLFSDREDMSNMIEKAIEFIENDR